MPSVDVNHVYSSYSFQPDFRSICNRGAICDSGEGGAGPDSELDYSLLLQVLTAGLWNSVSAPHISGCGKNKSRSTKLFRSVSHLLVNIYCSSGG